ncbi:agmatine deiminase family protein [Marinimicrobium alkaliphilum]|uniref:agmatine deiminase family protein n=1 Tax=Marinimicrobium alkaliphilum TaxID=2202654 RepID=UPI000DBA6D3D|nr:agmatine deiminase family protein [Marinimicrobium alkaliphilum]
MVTPPATAETPAQRLPAEWEPQDAVLLTWPHAGTDWDWLLDDVLPLYEALVTVIVDYADVILAVPEGEEDAIRARLEAMTVPMESVHLYPVPSNDTWARDHGPLTVLTPDGPRLLDFGFNGWGGKFAAELDNRITGELSDRGAFPGAERAEQDWVLEGGSIEVDGQGTLLTTEVCLLNPNRNPGLSREAIEARLKAAFGVRKVNWLRHGHLEGDDTDSHIDTLARLCPGNVIAYVQCDDPDDSHYAELSAMEEELKAMTNADGEPYTLVPLPWPGVHLSEREDGGRLPATYANFLIINGAVLVPLYDCPSDDDALEQVSQAFPGYEILGIPCATLIEQGGSLHCSTMQIPEGVLYAP